MSGSVRRHQKFAANDEVLVEVYVPLPRVSEDGEEVWHSFETEALWAESLGGERYMIRSAPFVAFDLAVEDVVSATTDAVGADGRLMVTDVIERGGGACYRVHSARGMDAVRDRLEALEEMDVSVEVDGEWGALDVPAQADLEAVYEVLVDGEEAGVWSFEEGWVRP